jgi:hypothetical protein
MNVGMLVKFRTTGLDSVKLSQPVKHQETTKMIEPSVGEFCMHRMIQNNIGKVQAVMLNMLEHISSL